MTDEILEDAAICQSCYTKFHEYDQYRTQAFKIQSALVDLFNTSSFEEAEAFHTELVKAEELSDLNIYSEPCDDHQEPFLGNEDFTEDHGEFVWANEENIMINNRQKKESPIKTVPLPSKAKMPRKQDGKPKKVRQVRTDERKFQCEICLKCFKEKSKWKVHRDIHKDERNVVCPVMRFLCLRDQILIPLDFRSVEKRSKLELVSEATKESTIKFAFIVIFAVSSEYLLMIPELMFLYFRQSLHTKARAHETHQILPFAYTKF